VPRRVAGPGLKSHRILRRVPAGRKASRITTSHTFHEGWSRWSRRLSRAEKFESLARANRLEENTKVFSPSATRERGDRDVRGSVDSRRRGKKTPTLESHELRNQGDRETRHEASARLATIRRSVPGVVKTLGPSNDRSKPRIRVVFQVAKATKGSGNTRGTGTRRRWDGRSRLDASRVLFTGKAQAFVVKTGR
jgi:hypothetical protein